MSGQRMEEAAAAHVVTEAVATEAVGGGPVVEHGTPIEFGATQAAPVEQADPHGPDATVRRLIGRPLTAAEQRESAAYDALRAALRGARDDAALSQAELARRLELGQSEVSRLETAVGPGTRLGRIRRYLAVCGAELFLTVRTAAGRDLGMSPDAPRRQAAAPADRSVAAGEQAQRTLILHILALDEAMAQERLAPGQAARLRQGFLRRVQEMLTPGGADPAGSRDVRFAPAE